MPRNRSRSRIGNRPGRRAHRSPGNKSGTTLASQGKINATNLLSAQEVTSNASLVQLTFDRPVQVGTPASVLTTDVALTGTSATTRNGISASALSAVSVRVALSGGLTQAKTYTIAIAEQQGVVVPVNGGWGVRSKTFAT